MTGKIVVVISLFFSLLASPKLLLKAAPQAGFARDPDGVPINHLKAKLRQGQAVFAAQISVLDPTLVEIAGAAGLDFLWIDAEHTNFNWERAEACVRAAELYNMSPIIRPTAHKGQQLYMMERALDIGFQGIVVTGVRNREEMKEVLDVIQYPPEGSRGVGRSRNLSFAGDAARRGPEILKRLNDQIFVLLLVETVDAVKNIDQILSLEAVDAVTLGHRDFCLDAGLESFSLQEPVLEEALTNVFEAAKRHGKHWTGIARNAQEIWERYQAGARMFYLVRETTVWRSRCEDVIRMSKSLGLR